MFPDPQPVKALLAERRISQSAVARRLEKDRAYLGRIFNGFVRPSSEIVAALSELLGEPAEKLFRPDALERGSQFPGDALIGGEA